jgi:hypothetical protein
MKNNRAQTMVEFLLVMIPFLLFTMAILQIAQIGITKLLVNHSAFTVARVGIVTNRGYMQNMVKAMYGSVPFKDKENLKLDVLSLPTDPELKIRVTYNMPMIFPLINKVLKEIKKLRNYRYPVSSEYVLPHESVVN